MTRTGTIAALLLAVAIPATARAQRATRADSAAIRAAALDYLEGWYAGDSTRMRRAVHPSLAKRIAVTRGAAHEMEHTTADVLVAQTGRGGGRRTPVANQRKTVAILDIYGNAASARIDASDWVDYLHLAKVDGRWQIVNVLWEMHPRR